MHTKYIFVLIKITIVYSLSCNDILEAPANKKINLRDLQSTATKEIVQCLAHLGKEQLPKSEADFIWHSIVKYYDGVANVPDNVLMILHWVTPALTPEDYANITLSNIDVIQNFGLNYGLSEVQLSAIAESVRGDFAGKEPEDYTYYDLTALRQILCAFNRSEIERIHPSAYREAAMVIGKLKNCSSEVMSGFATLAIQREAFGSLNTWTKATLKVIGEVSEYLPKEFVDKLSRRNANN